MARVAIRAIVRLGLDKIPEARQSLFGIQRDETGIGSNKTADKRFSRKLCVLIALKRMERLDADLCRRGHLLDSDSPLFTLLAQIRAQREIAGVGGIQGKDLRWFIACSENLELGNRLSTSR